MNHPIPFESGRPVMIFDGAMGTMIQQAGLSAGRHPETLNLTHPDQILKIHRAYVEAGADVITSNTFQAGPYKMKDSGFSSEEVIAAGVSLAKKSGARLTALDVGPIGRLMEPAGSITFEEAYEAFRLQMIAGEKAGADLILIETMSDLYETKAAVLAARESVSLPVIASMTFEADGRTFTGTDPVTAALTLQSLGVSAAGINCSMGPRELLPLAETFLRYARIPVLVQANAGLPEIRGGETVYAVDEEEYAGFGEAMLEAGVRILGGCCGTTPAVIRRLRTLADRYNRKYLSGEKKFAASSAAAVTAASSATRTVFFDGRITVIGERINPTGKPFLKEALRQGRMEDIVGEAIAQTEAGADLLDVNAGLPEIDEAAVLARVIKRVQQASPLPVQIDSADPSAIEAGLRACNGRPLVNSVNGKQSSLETVLPLVKKYGALTVCLTLDESGIPKTARGRFEIARRIVQAAGEYGIPKEDLLIDCLTLTASAEQDAVAATLEAIRMVKARLGVKTILGVSNVSFGLPARPLLNSVFLTAAMGAGLDAAILNPLSPEMMRSVDAFKVINGQDAGAAGFVARYGSEPPDLPEKSRGPKPEPPSGNGNPGPSGSGKGSSGAAGSGGDKASAGAPDCSSSESPDPEKNLIRLIVQGRKEEAPAAVRRLLETVPPLAVIDRCFVPALDQVGNGFERGDLFLPSLMLSAETVKACFGVIRESCGGSLPESGAKGKVIVATVHGDIHDIGKNIAGMLLENYGYEVIDLGKDVPAEKVVEAVRETGARLLGLSALMTTTVKSMKETIRMVKEAFPDCRIMAGGAVLNEEYARFAGADYYVKDAREDVEIAAALLGR